MGQAAAGWGAPIISLTQFWLVIAFCLLAHFWWSHLKSRETATAQARRLCKKHNLQFLDDTVSLSEIRPVRDRQRGIGMKRIYQFEYTGVGSGDTEIVARTFRDKGFVSMHGARVVDASLPYLRDSEGNRVYLQ